MIVIITGNRLSWQHPFQWSTTASQKRKLEICFLGYNRKCFTTLLLIDIFAMQSNDHFLPVISLKDIIIVQEELFIATRYYLLLFSVFWQKANLRKVYEGSQFKSAVHHVVEIMGQQLEKLGTLHLKVESRKGGSLLLNSPSDSVPDPRSKNGATHIDGESFYLS